MRLLAEPFDPAGRPAPGGIWRPLGAASAAALGLLALARGIDAGEETLRGAARAVETAAVHGGFLALGLIVAGGGAPGWCGGAVRLGTLLLAAAGLTRLHIVGTMLYGLLPLQVLREARRPPASRASLGALPGLRWTLAGLGVGTFLGAHLLATASLTRGYGPRLGAPAAYLGDLAYDIGANALSAEWLFRGALFSQGWRRWGFWPAAVLSTAMSLGRYLTDPSLPATLEVMLGAAFYLTLLGLAASALRARSGSLVPGYLAACGFFAAYRMLGA